MKFPPLRALLPSLPRVLSPRPGALAPGRAHSVLPHSAGRRHWNSGPPAEGKGERANEGHHCIITPLAHMPHPSCRSLALLFLPPSLSLTPSSLSLSLCLSARAQAVAHLRPRDRPRGRPPWRRAGACSSAWQWQPASAASKSGPSHPAPQTARECARLAGIKGRRERACGSGRERRHTRGGEKKKSEEEERTKGQLRVGFSRLSRLSPFLSPLSAVRQTQAGGSASLAALLLLAASTLESKNCAGDPQRRRSSTLCAWRFPQKFFFCSPSSRPSPPTRLFRFGARAYLRGGAAPTW